MIDLRVLGTLSIRFEGGNTPAVQLTQPKRLALLLYLVLAEPSGPKSRESLMALLWPDADDDSARHSLRNALYGLRSALGDDAIDSRGEGYVALRPEAIRCDALELRQHLREKRWEEALFSWKGELAPGFHVSGAPEFERWLDAQRDGFRRAIFSAAWHRVDELELSGDPAVIPAARRACALEPGDEVGARRLMRLLDATVGRSPALRAYDELVAHFRRELDAEPSVETRALAAQIKTRVESARMSTAPPRPPHIAPLAVDGAAETPISVTSNERASHAGWRIPSVTVLATSATLLLAAVSLFALRPAMSSRPSGPESAAARAQREGALRLAPKYRQDTASYAAYLRALALRFAGQHMASRDSFTVLVARNPLYAPGYAGLAHAHLVSVADGVAPEAEGYEKAEAAALKAIALDSNVASAYVALGMTEIARRWNIRGAGVLIDRGVALDPQDPEAHIVRGNWFKWQGEPDSALAEYRKSYEADPLSISLRNRLARALLLARRYGEAEVMYRQTIREYPQLAETYGELSEVYRYSGRPRDAMNAIRAGWEATGDSASLAEHAPVTSDSQAARVFSDWARSGLRELEHRARSGEAISASAYANAYAEVHDTTQALRWLDSMVVLHDWQLCCVRVQPQFDFLRTDPRYRAWERRLPWAVEGPDAVRIVR